MKVVKWLDEVKNQCVRNRFMPIKPTPTIPILTIAMSLLEMVLRLRSR
jgi:hypothetical protein